MVPTNWRAGRGRSARPVRREGEASTASPYLYHNLRMTGWIAARLGFSASRQPRAIAHCHTSRAMKRLALFTLLVTISIAAEPAPPYAPDRRPGEGDGPYERLILRGATLVDGTGGPPIGP